MSTVSPHKVDYNSYIGSKAWKARRKLAFRAAKGKCERCQSKLDHRKWNCHHVSYANLGNELPGDLQALCESCHAAVHGKDPPIGKRKRKKLGLKPDRIHELRSHCVMLTASERKRRRRPADVYYQRLQCEEESRRIESLRKPKPIYNPFGFTHDPDGVPYK